MQSIGTSFTSTFSLNSATQLSRPIWIAGFVLGLFLSWIVLSGDNAGRVNLLYLLLVYLFIPLGGALVSVVSLITGKGINIARLVSAIPIQSKSFQHCLHKLRQMHVDKQWFFLQTQAAALAYACGSVLVFLTLLLATDINFVWRSTVLDAEQLQPLLSVIAAPWWFWEAAQPSVELLRLTQDSRLNDSYANVSEFGQWWAFVLATQILYSGILRGALLLLAKVWLAKLVHSKLKHHELTADKQGKTVQRSHKTSVDSHHNKYELSKISRQLPSEYALTNWAKIDEDVISQLNLHPTHLLASGPIILDSTNTHFTGKQVLLVKAWEPPMGELQDYMELTQGVVFPVNYKHNKLLAPEPVHIEEWQRFTAQLPNWEIYQHKETGA